MPACSITLLVHQQALYWRHFSRFSEFLSKQLSVDHSASSKKFSPSLPALGEQISKTQLTNMDYRPNIQHVWNMGVKRSRFPWNIISEMTKNCKKYISWRDHVKLCFPSKRRMTHTFTVYAFPPLKWVLWTNNFCEILVSGEFWKDITYYISRLLFG